MPLQKYLDLLGSSNAVPGGGNASAFAGAMASALGKMVCDIIIKKSPAEQAKLLKKASGFFRKKSRELLSLSEKDCLAYESVMNAYKNPKEMEKEKTLRSKKIQSALIGAMDVPLKGMRAVLENLECLKGIGDCLKFNLNVKSDFGVAILLSQSAFNGCLMNVNANFVSIKDKAVIAKTEKEVKELINRQNTLLNELKDYL
ncbi:MAG: cyclodeaminase/cyclohydrolase family protein [Planctomycetes bacterium]|nr:cyclodeaminase/cyclohydrolase family protein [Planctomycetota bacterium]